MDRTAIFVDAGYLFAQGSAALFGSKRRRPDLVIDPSTAVEHLQKFANEKAPASSLLRIYWYDGALGGARPTPEQALLAHSDDVKLRLGFVNSAGQQKGVDSLIVTDLIELARLGSINDAILMSGDEDVRVGVQIAQNYGVRVHLLGIVPSRGSQSRQLLQESDTTAEWDKETIGSFLSLRTAEVKEIVEDPIQGPKVPSPVGQSDFDLEKEVQKFVSELTKIELQGIEAYWESERGVPSQHDRIMLPRCRDIIGRDLETTEKRTVRSQFQAFVKIRIKEISTPK